MSKIVINSKGLEYSQDLMIDRTNSPPPFVKNAKENPIKY